MPPSQKISNWYPAGSVNAHVYELPEENGSLDSIPRSFSPESNRAMPPATLGAAIDVPFISALPFRFQFGTGAIAPPGAQKSTANQPSA